MAFHNLMFPQPKPDMHGSMAVYYISLFPQPKPDMHGSLHGKEEIEITEHRVHLF